MEREENSQRSRVFKAKNYMFSSLEIIAEEKG